MIISCKFSDSVLENKANWFVDHWVHDTCNRVNTTNDSTNTDQEINEALVVLRNILSDGWEFKVEHHYALTVGLGLVVGNLVVGYELVDVIVAKAFLEVTWDGNNIEHGLESFCFFTSISVFGLFRDSIHWVVHIQIGEFSLNIVEIILVSKWHVVDFVWIIKIDSFLS